VAAGRPARPGTLTAGQVIALPAGSFSFLPQGTLPYRQAASLPASAATVAALVEGGPGPQAGPRAPVTVVLRQLGYLLAIGPLTPAARSATWRAIAALPGLRSCGTAADLAGRNGTGLCAANQVCVSGQLCLYQNKDLNANGGSYWALAYNNYAHDQWIYVGDGANDQTSSFINYRTFSSAVAKNKLDISRATCARIVGDAGQITEFKDYDLSDNVWPDHTKMNDTISAFMLMSTEWNLDCGEVFSFPSG
jgi:hypothetical protein